MVHNSEPALKRLNSNYSWIYNIEWLTAFKNPFVYIMLNPSGALTWQYLFRFPKLRKL